MADPTSNLSSRLSLPVSAILNSSKREASSPIQVSLTALQQSHSLKETPNQQDSMLSMFIKGMKIIQDQAMVIKKQAKQLQQQEVEIERLKVELKNAQEHQKKEAKQPPVINDTATESAYAPFRDRFAGRF